MNDVSKYIILSIENVLNYLNLDFFNWYFFIFETNYKVYVFVGAASEWLNDEINLLKLVDI